jgi:TonB-linked SusC/RagA family outer membrane protein
MKRLLLLAGILAILFHLPLYAQPTTVTGTVNDLENGSLIPGVNVTLKGTTRGTITDAAGNFSIDVPPDAVLTVSFIGYKTQEVVVGGSTSLTIQLEVDVTALSEVVVTALGVKQEKRALGYAAQELKGSELTNSRPTNIVSALQGRVAGVRIQNSSGAAGAGTSILIRGVNSLSPNRSSEPLFVIDGVPMSNETLVGNNLPSNSLNLTEGKDQYSQSNRAIDLNPDDIETLTVLKGPAATALYGLRASNGVVIVTTKKGQAGKPQVSYTGSVGWDEVNKTPGIQRQYREGANGVRRLGVPGAGTPFQTFGPRITENDPIYDNLKDFFRTGTRINNSLSVSGGNERSTYFTSVSHLKQKGIVPNSDWERTTFKLTGNHAFTKRFSMRGGAMYSNSGGTRPQGGDKSIMSALTYHTTSVDVNDYINPDGSIKSYAGTTIDNPRYLAEFSTLTDNVNRIIGYLGTNIQLADWLTADYQLGVDYYGDSRTRIAPAGLDITNTINGFIVEERHTYREINSNFLLTATHSFSPDLKGSVMVGNNVLDINYNQINARGEGFGMEGFYDLSNTANKFTIEDGLIRRLVGVFGDAKLEYKSMIYVNVTGRNDWSSTLPKENRSFFYPSINAGYVFTETLGLSSNPVFNYGKLRASWAQVGKDASAYQIGQYYEVARDFPFNGVNGFRKSTTVGSENLRSEKTTSLEFGTELKFFNNRLSLDATYYRALSENQIVEVPVSNVAGLSRYVTNAGEIRNQGVEVLLTGTPLRTRDFSWDVSLNWSANRSRVLSMPEGISEIMFMDDRIANKVEVGGSIGDLYGRPYKRDANGQLIIDASGYPVWSDVPLKKVGNALPDWMGGVINTFSWKGLSLSFLIEIREGGDVYDTGLRNRLRNGIDERTSERYVYRVFEGVTATGEPNTTPAWIDHNFYRDEDAYNGVSEILLQDASWVRLRSANISYTFGKSILGKSPFTSLTVSVAGNNLLLFTPYRGYDPEGSAYGSGNNTFGYSGLNIPTTRSVTLSVSANF